MKHDQDNQAMLFTLGTRWGDPLGTRRRKGGQTGTASEERWPPNILAGIVLTGAV